MSNTNHAIIERIGNEKINVNFLNKNQDVDEKSKYMYTALEEEEYDVIRSRCCPVSYRANRLRFFYFDITSTFLASSFSATQCKVFLF